MNGNKKPMTIEKLKTDIFGNYRKYKKEKLRKLVKGKLLGIQMC